MDQERLIKIRELVGEIRVKQERSESSPSVVLTINLCVPDSIKGHVCQPSRHPKTKAKCG